MQKIKLFSIATLVLLSALMLISCDKRSVELPTYNIEFVSAIPDSIYADGNDETFSEVSFLVKTNNGFPVVGEKVIFVSDIGKIAEVVTDDSGMAIGMFMDTNQIGTATIKAMIGASEDIATVKILEEPEEIPEFFIERIVAEPDTIYQDNNLTTSFITVYIRDVDGFAGAGKTVMFKSSIGNIIRQKTTDSLGVATVEFWDRNDLGLATITASIYEVKQTINVAIIEAPQVEEINLEVSSQVIEVDKNINVIARVLNTLGNPVQNGTLVKFSSSSGSFIDDQVSTNNGTAVAVFYSGQTATQATITCQVAEVFEEIGMTIKHGVPESIELSSFIGEEEVSEIPVDFEGLVDIEALVRDKFQNKVQNRLVNFTISPEDMGVVTPATSSTDLNGIARTQFDPNLISGQVQITATADSVITNSVLDIYSNDLAFLQFFFSGQLDINVSGSGGNESAIIRTILKDNSGNQIDVPDTVFFELQNAPDGTHLSYNGETSYLGGEPLEVVAQNGIAQVVIRSGTVAGTAKVRVFGYDSEGNTISAIKPNIVVHAGPPASIHPGFGGFNTGTSLGGGIWSITAEALVRDIHGNPVDRGTAVWFSLVDPLPNSYIYGSAYCGNESADGDSLPGTAYTTITYHGINTFDYLTIKAESGQIEQTFTAQLPLNSPIMEVNVYPAFIEFFESQPNISHKDLEAYCTVIDGQGNPISNAVLTWTTISGEYIEHPNAVYVTADDYHLTYSVEGSGYNRLRAYKHNVGIPTAIAPIIEQTFNGMVRIMGTNTAAEFTFIVRRFFYGPN
ncbi:MAG: hypothetical protein PHR06_09170 [Candidatus Cloacimonetes bacterium]|nr:hypothetical protein [Candidatus Cloacimonadota bacterium]